ncbi:acetolactate synthase large subunit [Gilvimarinus sp. F26214L]|uniref:acetolactate synthase large subunit n=1 Tax=Gilvimarinus sp. DZF01 TaxID=3461371 RepID=UPI004045939A
MNGAESLVQTLLKAGVDTCFTNPGTSEMHFVRALGNEPKMRSVLGLFEGVCTGAADGYARMTGKPAVTLLHLGPGLANGTANIHNARRAHSPMVNLIGDHATYHLQYDAPLASDVNGLARAFSDWVRSSANADSVAADGAEAVRAALTHPGQIASLIVPADCAWNETASAAEPLAVPAAPAVSGERIEEVARVLNSDSGARTVIVVGGPGTDQALLPALDQIVQASGATVLYETFNGRTRRGAGHPAFDRVAYFVEMAQEQFKDCDHVITIGAKSPVAFFAYPDKPSTPLPEGCQQHVLAEAHEDVAGAVDALVQALNAGTFKPRIQEERRPELLTGALSPKSIGFALGALLPEDVIIVDEAATSGGPATGLTAGIPGHDWLQLTGGSIGYGLPVATGAAVACPDRKVVCLHGDGGAMYTIQALWTQARENLNVVNVIFANRKYQILQVELMRVGASSPNQKTLDMLDISRPDLNFQQIAQGMGVNATRATTADEFNEQLKRALAAEGPQLIEAVF